MVLLHFCSAKNKPGHAYFSHGRQFLSAQFGGDEDADTQVGRRFTASPSHPRSAAEFVGIVNVPASCVIQQSGHLRRCRDRLITACN